MIPHSEIKGPVDGYGYMPLPAIWLMLTVAMSACAAVPPGAERDGGDYWDSGLVYHQSLHTETLTSGMGGPGLALSGLVSAVAATGNALYFIDQGAGQVVQVDMATMTARPMVRLRNANQAGLYADLDGKVYVVDRAERSLLVLDEFYPGARRLELSSWVGNPVDIAVIDQGQWLLVLDGLEGRVTTLDMFGGASQLMQPELASQSSLASPKAIAATGGGYLVLDGGADQVVGFDLYGKVIGIFASDELNNGQALAADSCGRFYVADAVAGTIYLGFADMTLPGRRIELQQLANGEVSDLWTDDVFLYVATRMDGIHIFLIDPECGGL